MWLWMNFCVTQPTHSINNNFWYLIIASPKSKLLVAFRNGFVTNDVRKLTIYDTRMTSYALIRNKGTFWIPCCAEHNVEILDLVCGLPTEWHLVMLITCLHIQDKAMMTQKSQNQTLSCSCTSTSSVTPSVTRMWSVTAHKPRSPDDIRP